MPTISNKSPGEGACVYTFRIDPPFAVIWITLSSVNQSNYGALKTVSGPQTEVSLQLHHVPRARHIHIGSSEHRMVAVKLPLVGTASCVPPLMHHKQLPPRNRLGPWTILPSPPAVPGFMPVYFGRPPAQFWPTVSRLGT